MRFFYIFFYLFCLFCLVSLNVKMGEGWLNDIKREREGEKRELDIDKERRGERVNEVNVFEWMQVSRLVSRLQVCCALTAGRLHPDCSQTSEVCTWLHSAAPPDTKLCTPQLSQILCLQFWGGKRRAEKFVHILLRSNWKGIVKLLARNICCCKGCWMLLWAVGQVHWENDKLHPCLNFSRLKSKCAVSLTCTCTHFSCNARSLIHMCIYTYTV